MRPRTHSERRSLFSVLLRGVVPTAIPLAGVLLGRWSASVVALLLIVEGGVAAVAILVGVGSVRRRVGVDRLTTMVTSVLVQLGFWALGSTLLLMMVLRLGGGEPIPPEFWAGVASVVVGDAATAWSIRRDPAGAVTDGEVTELFRSGAIPAASAVVFGLLLLPVADSVELVVVAVLAVKLLATSYFEWFETVHASSDESGKADG